MQHCIEVNNLTKTYGNRKVVNQLSFAVREHEVYGVLGHNGAGKSTTMEMILGLKKPDGGSAKIFGVDARKHKKEVFQKVGVQLQASNYQSTIKVEEACQELSALYKNPADYNQLLKQFKLDSFKKSYVNKLSGGERQKLSVVLALLSNPEIVFLDELTTGLDTMARREVWDILRKMKETGTTIVLTTHYMEEAQNLCDRIILIKRGEKVVEGTVEEVISGSPYDNLEEAYLWYMKEENENEAIS